MKKFVGIFIVFLFVRDNINAQSTKNTKYVNELWFTYLNQLRVSNKWELATDLNLRTNDDFVNEISVSLIRFGLSYYFTPNIKLSAGYAWVYFFPTGENNNISQNEHRPWQQIQWATNFKRNTMRQGIRLEERFRQTFLNDSTIAKAYNFNYRLRYVLLFELPLGKKENVPGAITFIASDEVMFNFGSEIVNNYFDQNRFYVGLKFQTGSHTSLQVGYLNIFQPLARANNYLKGNAIRLTCIQNFDVRKKNLLSAKPFF